MHIVSFLRSVPIGHLVMYSWHVVCVELLVVTPFYVGSRISSQATGFKVRPQFNCLCVKYSCNWYRALNFNICSLVKMRFLVILILILNMSETLSLIVNSSCSRQLGMESGQIEDYQIIASSSRSSELGPAKVRHYTSILLIPIQISAKSKFRPCEYIHLQG